MPSLKKWISAAFKVFADLFKKPFNMYKLTIWSLLFYMACILFVMLMASCSSSRRVRETTVVTKDSVKVSKSTLETSAVIVAGKKTELEVKTQDSSKKVTEEKNSFETELEITFETDSSSVNGSSAEFAGTKVKIPAGQKIKTVKVKGSGSGSSTTTEQTAIKTQASSAAADSFRLDAKQSKADYDSGGVSQSSSKTANNKTTFRPPWWLWILVVGGLAYAGYRYWKYKKHII